jgi:hypothetical protein
MKHPVEKGVMLGGESITDHFQLKARRQKHFADIVGRPLRFAFRDESLR